MKPRQLAVGVVLCGLAGLIYLAAQPLERSGQTSACESNLKQIASSMLIYIRDYDEKFPQANNWSDAMRPYVIGFGTKRSDPQAYFLGQLQCPTSGSFYVFNRNLAGISYTRAATATTPWIYEVGAGQNQLNISDNGKLWPPIPVHDTRLRRGNNVLFGDIKVRTVVAKPKFIKFAPTPTPKAKLKAKQVKP